MSAVFLSAIRQHDRGILERASQAPADLPAAIDREIGDLDAEARELAVELVARQDNENSGPFLLKRTGDDDANVATLAVDSIVKMINKPATADVLATIPERKDPFIRAKLYLEAGRRKEDFVLQELRKISQSEGDNEARLRALAARVKRGGPQERQEFMNLLDKTDPDDALTMQELLLYIGDANLSKGMRSWLDNNEDVMRLGGDRQNSMARMSDIAIWTAHLLGVAFPFEMRSLRNYTPDEIETAKKIFELMRG